MSERVLIVGTGLIGGSVGLGLRRAGGRTIAGWDADAANATLAKDTGALDDVAADLAAGAAAADVIVVATPVGSIPHAVEAAGRAADPGTVVTDVGSTKRTIVLAAEAALGERCAFVGGHPMAGTEGEGIAAARADLFDGAPWILTPTPRTDPGAYRRVNTLVTDLGARTLALDPDEHDMLVARVSHLPYTVATALMAMVGQGDDARVFQTAAGSFRDITRTAGTNPRVWHDILATNAEAVGAEIAQLIAKLESFRTALASGDLPTVDAIIDQARAARRRVPLKGVREPAEPVTVEVRIPDRAGVLAEVTTAIGEGGVNIEDLWMEHTPSGGVLRLVLDGRATAERAVALLAERAFRAWVLEDR